jgi:hypothetical protein
MSLLSGLFKKGGAVDKAINIVDKAVPDKDKANELKMKLIELMASQQSPITRYVRAIIAIMFMVVWLFFPDNMEGRDEMTKYIIYAIFGFYFLADFTIDKWKGK